MMKEAQPRSVFTGKTMMFIMVAFFGVIITVNFTMARFAVSGFSGTVVDNSYIASQNFNEWLRAAEVQDNLNWQTQITRDNEDYLIVKIGADNSPLIGAIINAELVRPLGMKEEKILRMQAQSDGTYRSVEPLSSGRWLVQLDVRHDNSQAYFKADLP